MWVVRDKDSTLWLCSSMPTREKTSWSDKGECIQIGDKFPFNQLPPFATSIIWEDTPIQVKFNIEKEVMKESGYYPPGAEFDSNAPYNQIDPPKKTFDIWYSTSISRTANITTSNYDGAGPVACLQEFKNEQYTPLEIMKCASKMAKYLLSKQDYQALDKHTMMCLVDIDTEWVVDDEESDLN